MLLLKIFAKLPLKQMLLVSSKEMNLVNLTSLNQNAKPIIDDQPNTHNLESNNQKGFNKNVGPKGSQISGGQKQRIAIARAILKKPSILLLDEATSALDAQSEKVVQESLDNIMRGKTAIIIAHRISTIRGTDEILVFNEGQVIEKGKYEHLVQKRGVFYKLEQGLDINS